jgi:hypothetical protein
MSAAARFTEAYAALLAAFESLGAADVVERSNEAWRQYVLLLEQASGGETMRHAQRAFEEYRNVLHEGFAADHSRASVRQRFDDYVSSVREAWMSMDVGEVDPMALIVLADEMRHAAFVALAATEHAIEPASPHASASPGVAPTWGATSAFAPVESGTPVR